MIPIHISISFDWEIIMTSLTIFTIAFHTVDTYNILAIETDTDTLTNLSQEETSRYCPLGCKLSIKSSPPPPPPPVRTCDDKLPSSTDSALEWCQPEDLAKLLPPLPTLPNVANTCPNTAKYGKIRKI